MDEDAQNAKRQEEREHVKKTITLVLQNVTARHPRSRTFSDVVGSQLAEEFDSYSKWESAITAAEREWADKLQALLAYVLMEICPLSPNSISAITKLMDFIIEKRMIHPEAANTSTSIEFRHKTIYVEPLFRDIGPTLESKDFDDWAQLYAWWNRHEEFNSCGDWWNYKDHSGHGNLEHQASLVGVGETRSYGSTFLAYLVKLDQRKAFEWLRSRLDQKPGYPESDNLIQALYFAAGLNAGEELHSLMREHLSLAQVEEDWKTKDFIQKIAFALIMTKHGPGLETVLKFAGTQTHDAEFIRRLRELTARELRTFVAVDSEEHRIIRKLSEEGNHVAAELLELIEPIDPYTDEGFDDYRAKFPQPDFEVPENVKIYVTQANNGKGVALETLCRALRTPRTRIIRYEDRGDMWDIPVYGDNVRERIAVVRGLSEIRSESAKTILRDSLDSDKSPEVNTEIRKLLGLE